MTDNFKRGLIFGLSMQPLPVTTLYPIGADAISIEDYVIAEGEVSDDALSGLLMIEQDDTETDLEAVEEEESTDGT